jgi:hypothetical protein
MEIVQVSETAGLRSWCSKNRVHHMYVFYLAWLGHSKGKACGREETWNASLGCFGVFCARLINTSTFRDACGVTAFHKAEEVVWCNYTFLSHDHERKYLWDRNFATTAGSFQLSHSFLSLCTNWNYSYVSIGKTIISSFGNFKHIKI